MFSMHIFELVPMFQGYFLTFFNEFMTINVERELVGLLERSERLERWQAHSPRLQHRLHPPRLALGQPLHAFLLHPLQPDDGGQIPARLQEHLLHPIPGVSVLAAV